MYIQLELMGFQPMLSQWVYHDCRPYRPSSGYFEEDMLIKLMSKWITEINYPATLLCTFYKTLYFRVAPQDYSLALIFVLGLKNATIILNVNLMLWIILLNAQNSSGSYHSLSRTHFVMFSYVYNTNDHMKICMMMQGDVWHNIDIVGEIDL